MKNKKIIRAVTVSKSVVFFVPIVRDLQNFGFEIVAISSPGIELYKLNELGVKPIAVTMKRRVSPFMDLKSLWRLVMVFRKERPYMVHSMTPKAGLLCMFAAWLVRVPRRVHTFTGLVWPTSKGLTRRILMLTDWLTCACATHIIPEGQGVMDDLRKVTYKPMRVLGYGNVRGVDMQKFSRRDEVMILAKQLLKKNTFTFLFVGRLVKDKGINELVSVFGTLHKHYQHVRLVLVGEKEDNLDPLYPETDNTIGNNLAIEAVGAKYGDELLAYYAASDCFVFPSYREGFPNVVLEAGAMGLPSIVTDINGSREIIEHGRNGWIIPPKDETALYEAMENVLLDYKHTRYVAGNARQMIANRYEKSFVQQCLYDFYDEIM